MKCADKTIVKNNECEVQMGKNMARVHYRYLADIPSHLSSLLMYNYISDMMKNSESFRHVSQTTATILKDNAGARRM